VARARRAGGCWVSRRRPSRGAGGPGSLGSPQTPPRAACRGQPSDRGLGQRCAPRLTSPGSPRGVPPMPWRRGQRGPRSRSRRGSAPRQRGQAVPGLARHSSPSSGGARSHGTRCGPAGLTAMVAPQTRPHRRRGCADGRFRSALQRCSLVWMPCPNRGGDHPRESYVLEVIQRPALSGYPTLALSKPFIDIQVCFWKSN